MAHQESERVSWHILTAGDKEYQPAYPNGKVGVRFGATQRLQVRRECWLAYPNSKDRVTWRDLKLSSEIAQVNGGINPRVRPQTEEDCLVQPEGISRTDSWLYGVARGRNERRQEVAWRTAKTRSTKSHSA